MPLLRMGLNGVVRMFCEVAQRVLLCLNAAQARAMTTGLRVAMGGVRRN